MIKTWNSDYSDTLGNFTIDKFSWLVSEEMESDIQKWIGYILIIPETKEKNFWES